MATKKVKDGYKEVTTTSGFTCQVEIEAMNDMRVLDILRKIDNTESDTDKMFLFKDMASLVLSESDYTRLCEHVATKSGRIPIDKMYAEFGEIFSSMNEAKKS